MAAGATWFGCLVGWRFGLLAVGLGVLLVAAMQRAPMILRLFLLAGSVAGAWAAGAEAVVGQVVIPEGEVVVTGRALSDTRAGEYSNWFLLAPEGVEQAGQQASWRGPPLFVVTEEEVTVGERLAVGGSMGDQPGRAAGISHAGRLKASELTRLGQPFWGAVGNAIRHRIATGLASVADPASRALLTGFLIGDDDDLLASDRQAMRAAGLSHFTAVSGSNVALFLTAWFLVAAPLVVVPRLRSVVGLIGLGVFVVVTRWQPSVLRAATMAGLPMVGRLVGIPFDPWSALGVAATGLLLLSPALARDVGFQLSVAATAGILLGTWLPGKPRWLVSAVGVSVAASAAVSPLLVWHFGAVPVLSPLANLAAAPLVAVATMGGGIGALLGIDAFTTGAAIPARWVLGIARVASSWPEFGWVGLLLTAALVLLALTPSLRTYVVGLAALALAGLVLVERAPFSGAGVVFLNVGQGDAALLVSGGGGVILVDGGPDPAVLGEALARYGIAHVDLLVITHPHADHYAGLEAVVGRLVVGRIWESGYGRDVPDYLDLLEEARSHGVPVDKPAVGVVAGWEDLTVEVLGPLRRYAGPNDQSILLLARVDATTVFLSGDIEGLAQQELGPVSADVLKVPHHGGGTSDPEWLMESTPKTAVISVGENDYGHPSVWVIEALTAARVELHRTDLEGDIVIDG